VFIGMCGEGLLKGLAGRSERKFNIVRSSTGTYTRSACCDSMLCDCTADAFCVAWSNAKELWLAVSKYRPSPNELYSLTTTCRPSDQPTGSFPYHHIVHTDSLLPGSLTVANCSSLYFLNAGARLCDSDGSLFVSALMSRRSS